MEGLIHTSLDIKREAGIDLSRDLTRNDLEDLLAELNQETVQGGIDLGVNVLASLLGL